MKQSEGQEDFTLNKVQLIKSIERDGGERLAKKTGKEWMFFIDRNFFARAFLNAAAKENKLLPCNKKQGSRCCFIKAL